MIDYAMESQRLGDVYRAKLERYWRSVAIHTAFTHGEAITSVAGLMEMIEVGTPDETMHEAVNALDAWRDYRQP